MPQIEMASSSTLRLLDMPQEGWDQIAVNEGPFKAALDHIKFSTRHPELDVKEERKKAASYLINLNERLVGRAWLCGDRPTLADLALLPFVHQFANIDRVWFDAQECAEFNGVAGSIPRQ